MATNFYKVNGSYYTSDTNQKVLDIPSLQKLAQAGGKEITAPTAPVGSQAIANPQAIPNYNVTANIGGTLYGTPKVVPPINPILNIQDFKSQTQVEPASVNTNQYDNAYVNALGVSTKSIQDFITQQNQAQQADKTAVSESEASFKKLLEEIGGRGTSERELQNTLGVNTMTQSLADVNTQLASRNAEFNSLIEANRNKPIQSSIIGGTESRLLRQKGIETGALASMAQAIQGNISTAKQTAKDTIDFEYAPKEQELELKKMQLERAYSTFDNAEKKRADQLLSVIGYQQGLIEAEKAVKSKINDIMIVSAKSGADAETLKNIMSSESEADAIVKAGEFLVDKTKGNIQVIGETTDPYGNTAKKYGYWDEKTQSFKDISGQTVSPSAGAMRTDRHNNPTAMTTDVANTLGLVEGKDYTIGDPFTSNGKTYYTARITGDPIATTIKALDLAAQDPTKRAFYNQSGGQRWSYTAMTDEQWLSLTPEQKKQKIAEMYQQEGGDGSLVGDTDSSQDDELAQQLVAYARQYASTGTIPTGMPKGFFGKIQEIAKNLPKPDGTLIDINTGVKPSKLSAESEQGYQALYNIVNTLLPQMKESFGPINTGVLGAVGAVFNPSAERTKYQQLRQEFLSQLLKARSGASVTEQEYQRYSNLLPSIWNNTLFIGANGEDKLQNIDDLMNEALSNKLKNLGVEIVGYSYGNISKASKFDE